VVARACAPVAAYALLFGTHCRGAAQ
jgi:hypothetical protein